MAAGIRLVLDALSDPVVASDHRDRIVYMNEAAERLLGWPAGELLGRPLSTMMPARFRAAHEAGFARFIATRRGQIMGRPVRVPALHHDGREIDIELNLSPIEPAPGVILLVATLRDLRERIELERRILSQRKILAQHAAVGVLAEAVSTVDAIPRLLEATALALQWHVGVYWTLEADGALHLSALWAARTSMADAFRSACAPLTFVPGQGLPGQTLQLGRPVWSRDVRNDERYVRARLAADFGLRSALLFPVFCASRTLGVLEYLSEHEEEFDEELIQTMSALGFQMGQFLERLRVEEELRAAVLIRDQFLSIASHELKTPLTSLALQIASLGRQLSLCGGRLENLPLEKLQKRVTTMESQCDRLAALINELLDVSRIAQGRVELHLEPTGLLDLVEEVTARMADDADRSGNPISVRGDSTVSGHWDRNRLDQVVTNLIGNALKYAPGKPVDVLVEAREEEALLRVSDQGPGISQGDQQRIFEQFERAASPNLGGMGLGLWIVRKIVDAHGGRIEVQSRPGQGATFLVTLPMRPTMEVSSPASPPA